MIRLPQFYLSLMLSVLAAFLTVSVAAQTPQYFNNNTATPSNSFPWSTAAGKGVQNFFPANTFPNSYNGMITKIYYKVTPNITTTYTSLTIKLGQTTNTALTTGAITTTIPLTTVYSAASITLTSNSSGWLEITLQTPFLYNPSMALISDVFNCSASPTGMLTCNFTPGGTPTRTYINNSGTCTQVYSGQDAITAAFGFNLAPFAANDLAGEVLLQPVNLNQYCSYTPVNVKARIKNTGSAAQSNFPIGAYYSDGGLVSGNLSGIYLGTLAPFATDSVSLGGLSLPPGNYKIVAYTLLSTDTLKANDTTPTVNFTLLPAVPSPSVHSDTVCAGMNASIFVDPKPNTVYNWYSEQTGGTMVNVGNGLSFSPLIKDTTMFVSGTLNGCQSPRVPITAAIGPPPVVKLGNDTSFCESLPLVLNAGNPGGKYLWSTGDSTQTISLTNISGKYWVRVDKYCVSSDSINVTIDPLPFAAGISYVRTGSAYHFTATSPAFVNDYLWIFGDGMTSSLPNPTHTFGSGINVDLAVRLVVANECGTDTVFRKVPTAVSELSSLGNAISVYPNPANAQLNISSETSQIAEIDIIDQIGKTVLKRDGLSAKSYLVDVSNLANGKYFMRIVTMEGSVYKPFVILR